MKILRIHYLQHVHFEDLGCIEDWAKAKGHRLSSTKFYENEFLPELSEFDWLIVMGGPMGVYDDEKYGWLNQEKEFIRNTILSGKTVLGICLGAQLIASVLGAKVYPNGEKEIGWFPISPAPEDQLLSENNDPFTVFHWHGDTFDLPDNAVRIASSAACLNQAYIFSEKIVGLQFHFEVTEKSLERMITFCADELVGGTYIQDAETILSHKHFIPEINKRMFRLLDFLELKL
ncbi:MAG: amidotransferase [Prolixibacteraceae bacterium]|jgi:GMP synthase-like glutamine amidotransferase